MAGLFNDETGKVGVFVCWLVKTCFSAFFSKSITQQLCYKAQKERVQLLSKTTISIDEKLK